VPKLLTFIVLQQNFSSFIMFRQIYYTDSIMHNIQLDIILCNVDWERFSSSEQINKVSTH